MDMENIKELKITYKDGSELNYNIDGFECKVQGEDSFSHVLVDLNGIKAKVNECNVKKADVSELKCDSVNADDSKIGETLCLGNNMRLTSGSIDTSKIHINEEMLANPDEICGYEVREAEVSNIGNSCVVASFIRENKDESFSVLTEKKDNICLERNCCSNEKSVYQEVMEYVTSELSDELWDIYNTSEEEQVCLECLVEYYLEKAYSEGYKEATKYFKDRIDEANQSVRDELLEEVSISGYGD